ncbi:FadR/GntR family transcriptional regulator [Bacillus marinisedimentorum]|uniref:FadR/GntR family transcriptional regulator n=1 Tax=Bacillus marinisedimentorum TaxID=1821260 RepID=UPI000872C097|nr:GntR family transcriptional regulator [Bacillus marinisedimentorum]
MTVRENKVYLEILKKIRSIIEEDQLIPGDRLPSERELSERLQAGRSSVREALRALELLGLIETRRGEGTFIRDSGENQLVELIGTFILQSEPVKRDLSETRRLLEFAAVHKICGSKNAGLPGEMRTILDDTAGKLLPTDENRFHYLLIEAANNRLLKRIFRTIMEYTSTYSSNEYSGDPQAYREFLDALSKRDAHAAFDILENKIHPRSAGNA